MADEHTGPRAPEEKTGDAEADERPERDAGEAAEGGAAADPAAEDGDGREAGAANTDTDGSEDGDGGGPEAEAPKRRGPRIEVPAGFEDAPTTGAGEGIVRALAQLREAHDALEKSRADQSAAEDRLVRLAAEFENYKKRIGREREEDRKYANEKLLKELLPVVDNLERALTHGDAATGEQLLEGVKMVHRQLLDTLKKFGVTQFSAAGEPFNPERHEAMQQMETGEAMPGTVVSEYMKGFELNGRLLRPAMVVVAKAPTEALRPPEGEAEGGNGTPPESSGDDSSEGVEG